MRLFRKMMSMRPQKSMLVSFDKVPQAIWSSDSNESLTREGYLKNVIVYRCVTLLSRGIASLSWLLYEKDKDMIHEHEVFDHPLLKLLRSPNHHQSGAALFEELVSFLLLTGNAFLQNQEDEDGFRSLHIRRSPHITIFGDEETESVRGYRYQQGRIDKTFWVDPITGRSPLIHFKFFNPQSSFYGLSPLQSARYALDQHNAVSSHNLAILQNGGRPSGAFFVKTYLTEEQRRTLKQDLKSAHEGTQNAGRILMIEGDMEWRELGLSPKDLDFVSGKNVSSREIAQAFGVPPILVGVMGDATFANYKEARYHLWEDTVLPLAEFVVSILNKHLTPLYGEGYRLAFDKDSIPALWSRRDRTWKTMINASFLSTNEKRAALGYGPIDGGDKINPPQLPSVT